MNDIPTPNLPQALLLLALDDDKGSVLGAAAMGLDFGLAGTAVMELALAGRITTDDDKFTVIDDRATGSPVLDAVLAALAAKPGKRLRPWVQHLPQACHLRQTLLDGLVAEGTLARRDQRILWIFHATRYPERDGAMEHDLRARMDAVLLHDQPADARTRLLIEAAHSCHLLDALYPRAQHKAVHARLKALQSLPDACASAIGQVLQAQQAQQAAIVAVICASTVAATAAATSAATAACAASAASC
ncbi:MAG TPA: GPP34 family phosphoprotein [Rhodanobacteraceae bacterium]|nr:GPP34 family phosphoprotein [Rhodanobacteraceae bacterium]